MLGLIATSLLALSMPLTALAGHDSFQRRHHEVSRRQTSALSKRVSGARATFYDVETGNEVACGGHYKNTDAVVAVAIAYGRELCGKGINIHYNGQTRYATIVDLCEVCPGGGQSGLDLTMGLFNSIADPSVGVISVDWEFADGGAPAAQQPPQQPPQQPAPQQPAPPAYTPPAIPDVVVPNVSVPNIPAAVIPAPAAGDMAAASVPSSSAPAADAPTASPFPTTQDVKCQKKRNLNRPIPTPSA